MDRKSPIDTHIGQRLKEYRQHRGMTVRELADAAHVTPGQISRYEHGRDRISHERVTEFARILRIKSNDLYQPPGSRLRRNHVRWRLTNFMAAVIAEAAALMSTRRKAVADNEAIMVAAVAVAVGASAAAASDGGAGDKSGLTTSADAAAVDISGSLSGAAVKVLLIMDGANTDTINLPDHYTIHSAESQGRGGKVAYDPFMSAAGEKSSAQSTSAENGFIMSKPFPSTETVSGNKDHSGFQSKPSMDHHAVTDPEINNIANASHDDSKINYIAKEQPEHPAHPHSDNFTFADDDGSTHLGHATGKEKDISVQPSADPKIGDIATEHPEHPIHPHSDVNQLASFKFADEGSVDLGHLAHPHFDDAKVPGTVMSGAASDRFVFEKGNDKVGDITTEHPEHPAHPYSDVNQLASFKFADEGGADLGHLAHPHFDNAKVPGTVMSGAASDQFVFEKGHDKVADVKPDMIETDHAVPDIRHLLHTAHDANAVGALDPNYTTAPQDLTKVQLPYQHGDFHFA
jgi:transcriptional regulator with XRE-family HTH domain